MVTGKYIRPKFPPRDGVVSSKFDGVPPLGIKEASVSHPVRDPLLAETTTGDLTELGRESGLRSDDISGLFKGGNVVWLHGEAEHNTRNRVTCNKYAGLTSDKGACSVLHMTSARKKTAAPLKRAKAPSDPLVGPDGLTMAQRVIKLMEEQDMGQSDLARACSRYLASFVPGADDRVKQQHIFNIISGQESSWVLPLIAAVFDVSDMWLQFGIGNRTRVKS